MDRGPRNIVIRGVDLGGMNRLEITGDTVVVDGVSLSLTAADRYCSRLPDIRPPVSIRDSSIGLFQSILMDEGPEQSLLFLMDPRRLACFKKGFQREMTRGFLEGIEAMKSGDFFSGVSRVRGLGFGLTPAGDDFLAGLLWGLYLVQYTTGTDTGAIREKIWDFIYAFKMSISA